MIPIYSTSKLVGVTLAGIAVFFFIFTASLLPAVLILPTTRYEEVSSFRSELRLLISNTTKHLSSDATFRRASYLSRVNAFKTKEASTDNGTLSNITSLGALQASELVGIPSSYPAELQERPVVHLASEDIESGGKNNSRSARNLLGFKEVAANSSSTQVSSTAVSTTGERKRRVTHPKSRGFIMATEYQQQLLGGFKGFYHLSKIASALNLSIVEPFVSRTSLTGVPSLKEGLDQCLKLSHFYDLYGLRDAFLQCSDVKLETFENFFTKSSHRIVMVDFLKSLDFYRKVFPPNGMNMKTIELKSDTKGTSVSLALLNQYAAHMFQKRCKKIRCSKTKYLFKKSRVILIDARPLHPLSWELVRTTLESVINEEVNKYGSVTLVLPSWRDIQPPGMISSFFYSMPDFPWDNCQDVVLIPHSKTVMAAADKFVADKMKPHPVVGVHIRAERLLIDYKGDVTHFMGCLKQLKNLLGNGTVPSVPRENVHLFHDLGSYGSQTCKNFCKAGYDAVLSAVYKLGYKILYYEPPDDSYVPMKKTLAAFVDREYLTRVDVLVTIGRGAFQQNIVDRFISRSGGKRDDVYRICHNDHPIPACYPHC